MKADGYSVKPTTTLSPFTQALVCSWAYTCSLSFISHCRHSIVPFLFLVALLVMFREEISLLLWVKLRSIASCHIFQRGFDSSGCNQTKKIATSEWKWFHIYDLLEIMYFYILFHMFCCRLSLSCASWCKVQPSAGTLVCNPQNGHHEFNSG